MQISKYQEGKLFPSYIGEVYFKYFFSEKKNFFTFKSDSKPILAVPGNEETMKQAFADSVV